VCSSSEACAWGWAMKRTFDRALFDEVVRRDAFTPQPRPLHFNRNTRIQGLCVCGESFEKSFRDVVQKGGGRCRKCVNVLKQQKIADTNVERYGCANPFQNTEVKQKIADTNVERYGCANPMQNVEVKQKIADTNVERYGCAHPMQNVEVRQKAAETNVERYGCANPFQNDEVKQKIAETNVERYGCANPFQNDEVKQKIADTNVERYGCAHPMQNAEVSELASKNAYKVKPYTFPCGDIRMVQGYEPFALDELVRKGYSAEDVITSRTNVPEVWWTAVDGSRHRYFVDIFIPKENRMIEVKSEFTAAKEGVEEKARASRDAGFVFDLWVYQPNGKRVN